MIRHFKFNDCRAQFALDEFGTYTVLFYVLYDKNKTIVKNRQHRKMVNIYIQMLLNSGYKEVIPSSDPLFTDKVKKIVSLLLIRERTFP